MWRVLLLGLAIVFFAILIDQYSEGFQSEGPAPAPAPSSSPAPSSYAPAPSSSPAPSSYAPAPVRYYPQYDVEYEEQQSNAINDVTGKVNAMESASARRMNEFESATKARFTSNEKQIGDVVTNVESLNKSQAEQTDSLKDVRSRFDAFEQTTNVRVSANENDIGNLNYSVANMNIAQVNADSAIKEIKSMLPGFDPVSGTPQYISSPGQVRPYGSTSERPTYPSAAGIKETELEAYIRELVGSIMSKGAEIVGP